MCEVQIVSAFRAKDGSLHSTERAAVERNKWYEEKERRRQLHEIFISHGFPRGCSITNVTRFIDEVKRIG